MPDNSTPDDTNDRGAADHGADRDTTRDDHRLSRSLRDTVMLAVEEARLRGASLVEAEHLLLALSVSDGTRAQRALAASGLGHAGIEAALRAEREASLRAAGVEPVQEERLTATPRTARPRWGTTARDALVRAHKVAARGRDGAARGRDRRTAESDLLAGILTIELGTVPRAIAIAGIDRAALLAAAG
ncbi:Clp protease N-terminal domain-containing protein [Leifsonia sp. Root227]|uniref:Clp protease N-terminal domain-containing protein n=1 Tax=Leifsonia sp. Root227 TaxID=1736496 RepID=UPI0009EBA616|nr:Clp protease N-terminal domain-containing protein [Leifsonia sp. Root227]